MKKLLAVVGALVTGGLGVIVVGAQLGKQPPSQRIKRLKDMKKLLAVISALITGGIAVVVYNTGTCQLMLGSA